MAKENRFNLVDEPWIPVSGVGLVSLRQIFSDTTLSSLGGNPVQKIAVTKLLLAIAQAAYTPVDDDDWARLGSDGMAVKALTYLESKKDCFWLYGEKPFLQMPQVKKMIEARDSEIPTPTRTFLNNESEYQKIQARPIGPGFVPDLPSENNTILTHYQLNRKHNDAEKALFNLTLMNFALGGKRVEKNLPALSDGYAGKTVSAKSGPSIGNHWGYLHSFLTGDSVLGSTWLNILTLSEISASKLFIMGVGTPPWEQMPSGEACPIATMLKNSYIGTLIALSRFTYLEAQGIYYVEGIQYPSHKDGWREPSITVNESTQKLLWVDPNKRPWREITALLSFMESSTGDRFDCPILRCGVRRVRKQADTFGIWSGGLKVRANSGDQSVKQDDDFVESEILLDSRYLGETWFANLKLEMSFLDDISRVVYGTINGYFKDQNAESDGAKIAGQASNLFWQLCERNFQNLIDACADLTGKNAKDLRPIFARVVETVYNTYCPMGTARQIDAWAKNRPQLGWYLRGEAQKSKTKVKS